VAITTLDEPSAGRTGDPPERKYGRQARGQGGAVLDVERIDALGGWK
jgi:hypothetical protein